MVAILRSPADEREVDPRAVAFEPIEGVEEGCDAVERDPRSHEEGAKAWRLRAQGPGGEVGADRDLADPVLPRAVPVREEPARLLRVDEEEVSAPDGEPVEEGEPPRPQGSGRDRAAVLDGRLVEGEEGVHHDRDPTPGSQEGPREPPGDPGVEGPSVGDEDRVRPDGAKPAAREQPGEGEEAEGSLPDRRAGPGEGARPAPSAAPGGSGPLEDLDPRRAEGFAQEPGTREGRKVGGRREEEDLHRLSSAASLRSKRSAAICSEMRPRASMIAASVNISTLMFVKRPCVQ